MADLQARLEDRAGDDDRVSKLEADPRAMRERLEDKRVTTRLTRRPPRRCSFNCQPDWHCSKTVAMRPLDMTRGAVRRPRLSMASRRGLEPRSHGPEP
mgnify:CR=1 FL=1